MEAEDAFMLAAEDIHPPELDDDELKKVRKRQARELRAIRKVERKRTRDAACERRRRNNKASSWGSVSTVPNNDGWQRELKGKSKKARRSL